MAKGQHFTRHQEKIVKRYYEHRDTIQLAKLGDLLGDLYLCDSDTKADKLWKRVDTALRAAIGKAPDPTLTARIDKITTDRDLEKLANLITTLNAKT